jgi:hypothetical protein
LNIRPLLYSSLLLLTPMLMQAVPVLITGTPADAYSLPNTSASPNLHGILVNFDNLTPLATYSTYTSGEVSISSPDGLEVLPFSSQSAPNEMFDDSAAGSANLSIGLTQGTTAIGVGIADSDAVMITLQTLNSVGTVFGPAFSLTIPETGANPGNGYYVVEDTTADIFGLKITQPVSNANYSGLAIDDVQVAPEPSTFILLAAGAAIFGARQLRKRA